MITVIGLVLWGLIALAALVTLLTSLLPGDPGGRWVFRVQGFIWLIGIVVTATLPFSKFHLLWIFPLGAVAPFAIMRRRFDKGMARLTRPDLEKTYGEVLTHAEMRRLYKGYDVQSPRQFAGIAQRRLANAKSNNMTAWIGVWAAAAEDPDIGEVSVIRRTDNVKGWLLFKEHPRFYFCWRPD
jgi:hypothetical protein